ncbi:hypothetical protein ElyMa_004331000 [Elysia marginata]|uniref:Uncharacterized protein n=1 Tax=Elysia marginata TaxID=1093978 RepID=A0AAV4H062_9GAST|nr:hypothetical protein ElyMa_004331000 [Elysia marginata]
MYIHDCISESATQFWAALGHFGRSPLTLTHILRDRFALGLLPVCPAWWVPEVLTLQPAHADLDIISPSSSPGLSTSNVS